jgi:predicted aspartyl protease
MFRSVGARTLSRSLCVLAAGVASTTLITAGLACAAAPPAACAGEARARFPIQFWNNHYLAAGRLNDLPGLFVLDTGAGRTAVRADLVAPLGLRPYRRNAGFPIQGRSIGVEPDSPGAGADYTVTSLQIGDYSWPAHRVVTVSNLPKVQGLHGLLGVDVFDQYDVEFDFLAGRMTFYDASACAGGASPPWKGPYETLRAIADRDGRLTIPVTLEGKAFKALIDTGSPYTFLSRRAARALGLSDMALKSGVSGLARNRDDDVHEYRRRRFDSFTVGSRTFPGLELAVLDDPSIPDVLIGNDYLQSHRMWLSYRTGTVFLQAIGDMPGAVIVRQPRDPGTPATAVQSNAAVFAGASTAPAAAPPVR